MNFNFFKRGPQFIVLALILILAVILRFYGLTNQSLWIDELHTMIEADPSLSWDTMFFYLKCCDPHPPLYFIIERFFFILFGYTEWVARSLSAVCGVMSVWAMYLLGKELQDRRLGIVAALLTCINYFNIFYSQEARCYIMAMLFAIFSYLYFIKLIKRLRSKHVYIYALFTILMLYSHYYSIFIVASQGLVVLIFLLGQRENKKPLLKPFIIAGGLIIIGYLPWLPFFIAISNIKSFWIAPILPDFAIVYFFDYFGNYEFLNPFLILLLIFYCLQVFNQSNLSLEKVKDSPLQLSFLIFFIAVAVTYFVPYLRSIVVVPMLFNRYTIVVVPAFIIALAFGFILINNKIVQTLMIVTFVMLSLTDLLFLKRFYASGSIRKTQFRQLTAFIAEKSKKNYPIVEEKTGWQHGYYLRQFNYNAPLLSGKKEATIDSILSRSSSKYAVDGFWLVGAHGFEAQLEPEVRKNLDTAFLLLEERAFFDAWAQLYISKSVNALMIDASMFSSSYNYNNDVVIAIWGGSVRSQPFELDSGKYEVTISQSGHKAKNEFPHINIYLNEKKIADFTCTPGFETKRFNLVLSSKEQVSLRLELDNDLMVDGEDRNAFVKFIHIKSVL